MKAKFYLAKRTPKRATQGPRQFQHVQLSDQEKRATRERQREARRLFSTDLAEAWAKIQTLTQDIAATHRKSVHRVERSLHMGAVLTRRKRNKTSAWNAFCWKQRQQVHDPNPCHGKKVLPELARYCSEIYQQLSDGDKEILIQEYEEEKASKACAFRTSTKSRVNDITSTITGIEAELDNLRARTGLETMIFSTRGVTELPIKNLSYGTAGVEDFLERGLKIDTQDFMGKMEGFAVQGVQGAAKNHQQRLAMIRNELRSLMTQTLQEITGDANARLHYVDFWCKIVQKYLVVLDGWPTHLPFKNFSDLGSSLPTFSGLLKKWKSGQMCWRKLTRAEYEELDGKRTQDIEAGILEVPSRQRRSDHGTKRSQGVRRKKQPQSPDTIEDDNA